MDGRLHLPGLAALALLHRLLFLSLLFFPRVAVRKNFGLSSFKNKTSNFSTIKLIRTDIFSGILSDSAGEYAQGLIKGGTCLFRLVFASWKFLEEMRRQKGLVRRSKAQGSTTSLLLPASLKRFGSSPRSSSSQQTALLRIGKNRLPPGSRESSLPPSLFFALSPAINNVDTNSTGWNLLLLAFGMGTAATGMWNQRLFHCEDNPNADDFITVGITLSSSILSSLLLFDSIG